MTIEIKAAQTNAMRKSFIHLPFLLHQSTPNWVPPLKLSVKEALSPKNPFFKQGEMRLWLAFKSGKPVGRIAGILNHLHNQHYGEKIAFWGFFDCINDKQVAKALFQTVEHWAKGKGMVMLRGPMNPSIDYECGLQISAFETEPFVMMPQNPSYTPALVESTGYQKEKDLQAWLLDRNTMPGLEKKIQLIKKMQQKAKVTIRPINMKRFKDDIQTMVELYNDAWKNNWGYLPLCFEAFYQLASELKHLGIDKCIFFAEMDGVPCGFAAALPDFNQLLKPIRNGRLLPLNWLKLLWQLKITQKITRARIALLGVSQAHQKEPIGAMLYAAYFEAAIKHPEFLCVELSWILEDNVAMAKALSFLNAAQYKTYRIYRKSLDVMV